MALTHVIQIGNSDNRLTQQEWAAFVAKTHACLQDFMSTLHFCGGPPNCAVKQNYCWIFELKDSGERTLLVEALVAVRKEYRQESVALMVGHTGFI